MCTNSTPAVWHTPGPAAPDGGYTSPMSAIDVLVLAGVALSAFRGAQRGLMATFLGLAGFAVGAVIGSRLAPVLLQNGRANGALRKLGAVQEGLLRSAFLCRGEYHDVVLWSILASDWRRARAGQSLSAGVH